MPGWSRVEYLGKVDRAAVGEIFERASAGIVLLKPTANYLRSHPTKMFEYMALGRPIVSTRMSMIPEILDGCGALVPLSFFGLR